MMSISYHPRKKWRYPNHTFICVNLCLSVAKNRF